MFSKNTRYYLLPVLLFLLFSCRKYLKHERWIKNESSKTLLVQNPDLDSVYVIAPGEQAMIYSYERLEQKHDVADSCHWLGDTLYIQSTTGDTCKLWVKAEFNWGLKTVPDGKRDHIKTCTLTITDDDF
jgi:hypothetical protein